MNLSNLIDHAVSVIKANAPEILTALGVAGVATTSYLSAKAGYQHAVASEKSLKLDEDMVVEEAPLKEKIKDNWRFYIPAAVSGAGTVACIIFASKGNAKRTAAAVTAYTVTEKAFTEYREKVAEQLKLTEAKQQKALDAIAQDRVNANPPPANSNQIIVLGRDEQLFFEQYTGRYFRSSVENINRAVNEVNRWINTNRRATLNDFYNEIGLPATDDSGHQGWTDEELMAVSYSAVMTDDERTCMAFRYNYVKPLR